MPVPDDDIMDILRKAIYVDSDLGYIADGPQNVGIKRGDMLIFYPCNQERPVKIRIEYALDLETGEVSFLFR